MRVAVWNCLSVVTLTVIISLAVSQDVDKKETTTTEDPTTTKESTTKETSTTTEVPPTTKNTSTPASTTVTSTHAPSPPTSSPGPAYGTWIVQDDNNYTCIILQAEIRMLFNYHNDYTKKIVTNYEVRVPGKANTRASGECDRKGEYEEYITLEIETLGSLSLTFNRSVSKYEIIKVKLNYDISKYIFPNATEEKGKAVDRGVTLFPTDETKSYKCEAKKVIYNQTLNDTMTGLVQISVQSLQVQAFLNTTLETFSGGVNHCSQDEVSQLVPIIVGATLAGLIIVVLIAYLIGRRRSRRGYESV